MRVRNIFGNRYSGTLGDNLVAVEGRTMNYLRKYAKPSNPNSERQQVQRNRFARSLAVWQGLSPAQKELYNGIESRRRGYDVFMSRAILALVRGEPIEVPRRMSWTPEGGPIEGASLVVRRRNALLFDEPLRETVEVAVTPSDAPYVLVLTKGSEEDEVLTLIRAAVTESPPIVESARLGVRLVPKAPVEGSSPPTPS